MFDTANFPNIDELERELASRDFAAFVLRTMPGYQVNWHHKLMMEKLQAFQNGEIKNLMMLMGPQHGKSQLSSRHYPAFALGKNPDLKIAIVSYALSIASTFTMACRKIMESEEYSKIFPGTRIKGLGVQAKEDKSASKTRTFIEVSGCEGSIYGVGIGGPLTSKTVDLLILDDTAKGRTQAMSNAIQLTNNTWLDGDAKNRLHNDSQILAVNTRWCEGDIPGKLLSEMRSGGIQFEVLEIPTILEEKKHSWDPRDVGDTLWPERHSRERMEQKKKESPAIFEALHQQNPQTPKELRVYDGWEIIDEMPDLSKFYGEDFGYNNPDAIVECMYKDGHGYVNEILYKTTQSTKDLISEIKKAGISNGPIYADTATPRTIVDIHDEGVNIKQAAKGPGSVLSGIRYMQGIKMHVTKRSVNILHELKNYQWQVDQDGKPLPGENPVERYDHLLDAIRYAFTSHIKRRAPFIVRV